MTDNLLGYEDLHRAEGPEPEREGRCGDGLGVNIMPAPQEVIQQQARLLTRVKRDMRALSEKIDNNASLLSEIVHRLEVIERKLDNFLESKRNFEAHTSHTIQINGMSEDH